MNIKQKLASFMTSHTFFSGIFVLFVTVSALQITLINYNFKTNEHYFPLYITIGCFFFLVKSFLSGFNFIDRSISKNLWFFLVFHSVTIAAQIWFMIMGLTKLTASSYPNEFFLFASVASSIYLLSAILSKANSIIPTALFSFITLSVSFAMVTFQLFSENFLFLQIISLVFLVLQITETFVSSRHYFSKEI
jgi:hypothetical protein